MRHGHECTYWMTQMSRKIERDLVVQLLGHGYCARQTSSGSTDDRDENADYCVECLSRTGY